jgi:teichuronic acid exporter
MNAETLKLKVLGSMRWNGVSVVSKFGSEYFVRLGLTAILAPDDFGVFAIALSLIGVLQVFINFGFQASLIRRKRDFFTKDLTQISYAVMLRNASFVTVSAVVISWNSFHFFFENDLILDAFLLLLPTLFLVPWNVISTAQLSRQLKFDHISKAEILSHMTYVFLVLFFVLNNMGYLGLIFAHGLAQLVRHVSLRYYSKQKIAIGYALSKYKNKDMNDGWGSFSREAFWFFKGNIVATVRSKTDLLMVATLAGNAAAGVYSMAFALTDSVQMQLASIVNKTMFPVYSSLEGDRAGYERAYYSVSMWISLLLVPAYTLLYIFAEVLVSRFLSTQWLEISLYLKFFSISSIIYALGGYPSELINALGRADLAFRISLGNYLLVSIPSLIFLIYWWGPIGAPISLIIHYSFLRISHLVALNRVFNIKILDLFKPMIPGLIICVLFLLIEMFVRGF